MRYLALLLVLALTACNDGDGNANDDSSSPGGTTNPSAAGIWQGTVKDNDTVVNDATCVIAESDDFVCFFFEPATSKLAATAHGEVATSGTQVSGSGRALAVAGFTLNGGATDGDFTIDSGTIDERKTLNLNVTMAGASAVLDASFDSSYDEDSSLDAVDGVYQQVSFNGEAASFVINGGVIDAQTASGCIASGNVGIIDAKYNAYNVTMEISGCTQLDGNYSGLGVITDFDADAGQTNDVFLFAVFDSENGGIAAAAVK